MSILSDAAADLFVKPVSGHDDLVAFQFPFALEGKADSGESVTTLDDGDLLIEGWAAVFEGEDRQHENFAPGAFQRGIKSFLENNHSLCYHHKPDITIGEVLGLEEVEGKGLYMRARVDHQPESSPHRWIYNAVKKRSMQGLSVGGYFKRAYIEGKRKIIDMDFTDVSITGVPVHAGPRFAIIAGKALESEPLQATTRPAGLFVPEDLLAALKQVEDAVAEFEAKALPLAHDPDNARWLGTLLQKVGETRSFATTIKDLSTHPELTSLVDNIETFSSEFEAVGHRLASKIGPIPPVGL